MFRKTSDSFFNLLFRFKLPTYLQTSKLIFKITTKMHTTIVNMISNMRFNAYFFPILYLMVCVIIKCSPEQDFCSMGCLIITLNFV